MYPEGGAWGGGVDWRA